MRFLIAPFLCCLLFPPLLPGAEPQVVPIETTAVATDAAVPAAVAQAELRKMTRAERKLAREVIADAADAAGMRRLEFMRAANRGDRVAVDELKVSLAAHDEAREIDIDRLQEILQMILDFIKQLLELFSMFAQVDATSPIDFYACSAGMFVVDACPAEDCRPAPLRGSVRAAVVAVAGKDCCHRKPVRKLVVGAVKAPGRAVGRARCRRACL